MKNSSSLRTVRLLVAVYTALSILSVIAMAVLSAVAPKQTTTEAWVHSIIIAVMSVLLYVFAKKTAAGNNAKALLRVRIITAILLPALVVVLALLPLPLWLKIEHVADIALLAPVAWIVFKR